MGEMADMFSDWDCWDFEGHGDSHLSPEVGDTFTSECRRCGELISVMYRADGRWKPYRHTCDARKLIADLPDLS